MADDETRVREERDELIERLWTKIVDLPDNSEDYTELVRDSLDSAYSAGRAAQDEEVEDLHGIIAGLQDVAAGRTKPIAQITAEMVSQYTMASGAKDNPIINVEALASAAEQEKELREILREAVAWLEAYGHDWKTWPEWCDQAERVLGKE